MTAAKPPAHLQTAGRRLWRSVTSTYDLAQHEIELLNEAAVALDRSAEARGLIDKHGVLVEDRFGALRANPAVAVERDSRLAFARLLREIGLAVTTDPPHIGRQRYA